MTVFAISVCLTSVNTANTCTSMMGISTEVKISTWSNLCKKIRNMEPSDCLKCFLTKTGVLDWKRWSKNWQHRRQVGLLCGQCKVDHYPMGPTTVAYLCCQFLDQRFKSTKIPVFARKHFKQSLCFIFLIFSQRFDQVLIFITMELLIIAPCS